jgi:hypothetical protein
MCQRGRTAAVRALGWQAPQAQGLTHLTKAPMRGQVRASRLPAPVKQSRVSARLARVTPQSPTIPLCLQSKRVPGHAGAGGWRLPMGQRRRLRVPPKPPHCAEMAGVAVLQELPRICTTKASRSLRQPASIRRAREGRGSLGFAGVDLRGVLSVDRISMHALAAGTVAFAAVRA